MKTITIFCGLLCLLLFNISYSQDCSPCEKVLIQDFVSFDYEENKALEFLDIIDREKWNEIQRKGGLGIKFPIKGIPIGGNVSWDKFNTARDKEFQKRSFQSNASVHEKYVKKHISERGYESYDNCILACNGNIGLYAWVSQTTPNKLWVTLRYNAGNNPDVVVNPVKVKNIMIDNGEVVEGIEEEQIIQPHEKLSFEIKIADPSQVTSGVLNIGRNTVKFKGKASAPTVSDAFEIHLREQEFKYTQEGVILANLDVVGDPKGIKKVVSVKIGDTHVSGRTEGESFTTDLPNNYQVTIQNVYPKTKELTLAVKPLFTGEKRRIKYVELYERTPYDYKEIRIINKDTRGSGGRVSTLMINDKEYKGIIPGFEQEINGKKIIVSYIYQDESKRLIIGICEKN